MAIETIDHTTLTKLAEAGVVRSAHVVGQAGGWGILVKYGMTERALASQRSHQIRIFRKLETLVEYLKGVGIPRFDVDAVNYDPEGEHAYKRPDRAEAMKQAHQAAAYDKWLKAEIQAALDDPRSSIPNEEVKKHFADRREALRKRIAAKQS
jgi:hypothetical protein